MFILRFFAGPIVHKISPLGLLFCSAVLGCIGLLLLGQAFDSFGTGLDAFWFLLSPPRSTASARPSSGRRCSAWCRSGSPRAAP